MSNEASQHAGFRSALRSRIAGVRCKSTRLITKANSIVTQWVSLVPGMYHYCCEAFFPYFDPLYNKYAELFVIQKSLLKIRVKLAKKRHDLFFFHNINRNQKSPHTVADIEIEKLFPSRKQWPHIGKEGRSRLSPIDRNINSLSIAVERERKKSDGQANWFIQLENKSKDISALIQKARQKKLTAPKIIPVPKDKKENTYRPIASFDLESRIRIGAAASYIREKIDPLLYSNSYAFRAKNIETQKCPTHHDAIEDLVSYRKKHHGETLYVAECDIQKFFDIVNHDVANQCLRKIVSDLRKVKGSRFDSRVFQAFRNYLKCYTYFGYAVPEAEHIFQRRGNSSAKLAQPSIHDLASFYGNPLNHKFGIPQGGALSPVIANIVLHFADEAILNAYGERDFDDLFYARYCDDMIIVHPDREVCTKLLDAYLCAMKRLKLLVHEPMDFYRYDKSFYKVKSKKPYPWTTQSPSKDTVPWVSFVGYQVNYDGTVRIRKQSIEKEKDKQRTIAVNTIRSIKNRGVITEKTEEQILHRLKCKLYTMAVGKRYPNTTGLADGMCWATGFKLIDNTPYVNMQLRSLDKSREKSIRIVKHVLSAHKVELSKNKVIPSKRIKISPNEYFGYPYSYYSGFRIDED